MKKCICKVILILFVVLVLLLQCGCKDNSISDKPTENSSINTNPIENEAKEENEESKVFNNLSIDFEDANEPYHITIQNDDNFNNACAEVEGKKFTNIKGKELIKNVSTSVDWGEKWDTTYDINKGVSKESAIIISPTSEMLQRPSSDLREIGVNYYNFYLQIASKNFSQIAFKYYDKMLLENNIGEFSFLYYPFKDFSEETDLEGYFNGQYYQVLISGETENETNVLVAFDKEKQEFTLTAENNITNIRIETTLKNNTYKETVCDASVLGKNLTITINEDCTANVIINK